MLRSLKYNKQLLLAHTFGSKLAEKILAKNTVLPDRIVPVPLHPKRLFFRGYNQALEIARAISKDIAVPLDYTSCKRIRNTPPQFSLNPADRKKNIKGAFSINSKAISGSVAIVDDIVTTGQTANELALSLKAAGASQISLWACAHSA
jgi:ComF family protein